jgi:hypothetical protein
MDAVAVQVSQMHYFDSRLSLRFGGASIFSQQYAIIYWVTVGFINGHACITHNVAGASKKPDASKPGSSERRREDWENYRIKRS